nr:hypothetical protein [Tanacetum cinerariifolium]
LVPKTTLLCLTKRTMCHGLRYAKSRPNGKLIHNSIINGPYVRRMIPEPGDTNRKVPVNETFHVQTEDELTEKEHKQIEADDQAIQTILLGLPEDIYTVVDSCETAQEIQMIPEPCDPNREVPVNETFHMQTDDELTEKELKQIEADDQAIQTILLGLLEDIYAAVDSCKTAQEILLRTKDLHTADYTQLYDFLKYNQNEVDDLKAERLARTQDPLALMATYNNPYTFPVLHQDQPSFNQNYMQQPIPNPEDITDPTTAMNMALALMAKAFKLNYSTPTNNNQRISSNPRNGQIAQPRMNMGNSNQNLNENGNLVAARAEGNATGHNGNQIRCYNCRGKEETGIQLQAEEFDLMAATVDLDEIEKVNANCILMANLQQASTSMSTMEPKNVKEAMTDPAWIESMQEELLQFKRLDV